MSGRPAAEIEIGIAKLRALLRAQHPDLADLPIEPAASGWDNLMFRLGAQLAVRLPRRAAAVPLLRHEQIWLPLLADRLPLPIPAPLRIGQPSDAFPWGWSIVPWLAGQAAEMAPPNADQAEVLAHFLRALHQPAPATAPINPVRGCPLGNRLAALTIRINRLAPGSFNERVQAIWQTALDAPLDMPATWIHGDLHGRNTLVEDGRFSAVIDWGDMTTGDPATDLAAIWTLLPARQDRQRAIDAYDLDSPAGWARARGWAVLFGVIFLDAGAVDDPGLATMGREILRRVSEGP